EIRGDAAARDGDIDRAPVRLQPADARTCAARDELDLLTDVQVAVEKRPRHHRAEAGHRESAIDGEPRAPGDAARGRRGERSLECADERVEADPRPRGDLDDRRSRERRSGKRRDELVAGKRGPRVVDEVALRERDDATLDAEQ